MNELETSKYRIDSYKNTPLKYAVDRKERQPDGTICLINVGWFGYYNAALDAMRVDRDEHK